jgi:hypothetical protein
MQASAHTAEAYSSIRLKARALLEAAASGEHAASLKVRSHLK